MTSLTDFYQHIAIILFFYLGYLIFSLVYRTWLRNKFGDVFSDLKIKSKRMIELTLDNTALQENKKEYLALNNDVTFTTVKIMLFMYLRVIFLILTLFTIHILLPFDVVANYPVFLTLKNWIPTMSGTVPYTVLFFNFFIWSIIVTYGKKLILKIITLVTPKAQITPDERIDFYK